MRRFLPLLALCACHVGERPPAPDDGIAPERVADMIHAVVDADRKVYASRVVDRLVREQKLTLVHPVSGEAVPFAAAEDWKDSYGALPLPAQMFRMGAELALEKQLGMSYALLSSWPINPVNKPRTDAEVEGLRAIAADPKQPIYRREALGGRRYLTAIYADVAVAEACVNCHDAHPESPRHDFHVGDVMGGVVVRVPLE